MSAHCSKHREAQHHLHTVTISAQGRLTPLGESTHHRCYVINLEVMQRRHICLSFTNQSHQSMNFLKAVKLSTQHFLSIFTTVKTYHFPTSETHPFSKIYSILLTRLQRCFTTYHKLGKFYCQCSNCMYLCNSISAITIISITIISLSISISYYYCIYLLSLRACITTNVIIK